MKLKPLSLGLALGILGALSMLVITYYPLLTEQIFNGSSHGGSMRFIMKDLYPWYAEAPYYKVLLGLVYGFIDGFLFGVVLAWLYNAFLCEGKTSKKRK